MIKIKNFKSYFIILWLILILSAYLKAFPFTDLFKNLPKIDTLTLKGSIFWHFSILIFFIISFNGWGKLFLKHSDISRLEKLLFSTGLGIGFLSLLVFFMDLIGFINKYFYFFILLIGSVNFIRSLKDLQGKLLPYLKIWLIISLFPLLISVTAALAPPTQFDSLVYHLALPFKYIMSGKIYNVQHNLFFSFPQNLEMLFQLALVIDSDILANLLHWMFLPLTGLAIVALTRRYWDLKLAFLASSFWLFTPIVLFVSTGTYVDLGLTFFSFLSFYCFILWEHTKKSMWLYYSAVFTGLALGIKYTGAISFIIILFLILIYNKSYKIFLKPAIIFSILTLFVLSPWILKNIIFLKNPFAPWASKFFLSSSLSYDVANKYLNHIKSHGIVMQSLLDYLKLPWEVTISGYKFGGGFDILGPLFLLFMPVLFLNIRIDRINKIILIYSCLFILIWLFTGKALRFLLPILPFLCILSAHGFTKLNENKLIKSIAYVVLFVCFLHNTILFHWVMAFIDPYQIVLADRTRNQYLANKLNYYMAVKNINIQPTNSKVLFLGETRSYYCRRENIAPTIFDNNPLILYANESKSHNDLLNKLKNNEITHILVNNYELNRLGINKYFSDTGIENFSNFKNNSTKLTFKDKYCEIYEINN